MFNYLVLFKKTRIDLGVQTCNECRQVAGLRTSFKDFILITFLHEQVSSFGIQIFFSISTDILEYINFLESTNSLNGAYVEKGLEDKLSVLSVKIAFGYPNLGNNHFVTSPVSFPGEVPF